MLAETVAYCKKTNTYDLECKTNVPADRIRLFNEGGPDPNRGLERRKKQIANIPVIDRRSTQTSPRFPSRQMGPSTETVWATCYRALVKRASSRY